MKNKTTLLLLCLLFASPACRKSLLNEMPDNNVFIPSTLDDCYNLLDNETIMDRSCGLGELSADDYYFSDSYLPLRSILERNTYLWERDIYAGTQDIYDWNIPYQQVFYCNVVLEALAHLSTTNRPADYDNIKAIALFKRSFAFFNVAQLFAPPFDSANAGRISGIPLKLSSDIHEIITRASLSQTYQQITADLKQAATLVTMATPGAIRNRPCRASIYAMLSRVYLSMGSYPQAGLYADSSLQLHDSLINYNVDISYSSSMPFRVINAENMYNARIPSLQYQCIQPLAGMAFIDSLVYQSYSSADLRRYIFFNLFQTYPRRKGFYDGSNVTLYTGLAVDEMYLNRAECLARAGNTQAAITWLNKLMINRIADGAFTPLKADNALAALRLILEERRKELIMRGLRWSDIRRLNSEGYNIQPKRFTNNRLITLPPGSKLYTLPIPSEVIQRSGITQNER